MTLSDFARKARGLAGVAAASLPALSPSSGQAATGTIQDVQHVVILMQENRAFDHYFGAMGGVRGYNDRNPLVFPNGQSDLFQPQGASNYVLPFPLAAQCITDVDHSHGSGLADWDSGKWDQWVPAKGPETMCYYTPAALPFHYALVNAYTICDDYFCSLIGPTYPNRLYLFTGMVDPNGTGGGPAIANQIPPGGFTWTTYPERLQAAGVSWRVYRPTGDSFGDVLPWFAQYRNATPGNPLYDRGVAMVPDVVAALQSDITNGTLPQVSWIIPTMDHSEHPLYAPVNGGIFIKRILDALASNPAIFNSTVFFITYDENGGFYDHVPSPIAPTGTPDEYVNGQPLGLGVRVPMIIVSPWSRGGHVCSQVFDHSSILRFLESWTGVREPNISAWRRQVCGDLTSAFDFANPDTSLAVLPNVAPDYSSAIAPAVPAVQTMPMEQTNSLLAMPLPYQPEVAAQADCATGQLYLTMSNSGSASVHLAVYANFAQSHLPWQFDVNPGSSLTNSFAVSARAGNAYDFTCYGPDGFQRRFAGSVALDCNEVEAASAIDTNAGVMTLTTQNATGTDVTFILTDGYGLAGPWTNDVPPGLTGTNLFPAVAANHGWYDLTVTCDSDAQFLRHFTGHIETGSPMPAEPGLYVALPPVSPPATNAPPVVYRPPVTNTPVAVTNSPPVIGLLGALEPMPGTNSLPLYATSYDTNLVLVYPAWASNCVVQASPSPGQDAWSPQSVTLNFISNYVLVTVPLSPSNMFFRLQQ
jgi:phospholipase C